MYLYRSFIRTLLCPRLGQFFNLRSPILSEIVLVKNSFGQKRYCAYLYCTFPHTIPCCVQGLDSSSVEEPLLSETHFGQKKVLHVPLSCLSSYYTLLYPRTPPPQRSSGKSSTCSTKARSHHRSRTFLCRHPPPPASRCIAGDNQKRVRLCAYRQVRLVSSISQVVNYDFLYAGRLSSLFVSLGFLVPAGKVYERSTFESSCPPVPTIGVGQNRKGRSMFQTSCIVSLFLQFPLVFCWIIVRPRQS